MPALPHPYVKLKLKTLPDLRMWRIRGFERYPVFYHRVGGDVNIERIIHAAQDYQRVLI